MPDRDPSSNDFEADNPGTNARSVAEAAIEELRLRGGVFVNAVRATRMPMILTDPNLPGNPIVFANESFLKLSGYSMAEVLGQQPHFMNGSGTDPKDAARFAEMLRSEQDDIIETVQYRKDGSAFVATVLLSAYKDEDGRTLNHFMSWLDVTRRVEAEEQVSTLRRIQRALETSEAKYRGLLNSVDEGFCIIEVLFDDAGSPSDYVFLEINKTFERQTGISDAVGRRMREIAPQHEQHWFDTYGRIAKTGVPECFEHSAQALGRYYDVYAFRVGDPDQRHVAILFHDIGERKRAEAALRESSERQATLLAELQHRVRNTLSVVRSIVRRTADRSESVDELVSHFEGRLSAFSRVQSAVTRAPGKGVDLREIIEDELLAVAAREGDHLAISGPDVCLQARPAESISLAVHELATNAIKYGALAVPHGKVSILWVREGAGDQERLNFTWSESGLEDRPSERREGFGMDLLRKMLPYDLGARTAVDFGDTGIRFTMQLPLAGKLVES